MIWIYFIFVFFVAAGPRDVAVTKLTLNSSVYIHIPVSKLMHICQTDAGWPKLQEN